MLAQKSDMETIHKIAYPAIDEKIRARFELLRANKNTYEFLIGLLQEFTKDGLNEFHFHLDEGERFFDLACGKTDWKCGAPPHDPANPVRAYWSVKDKRALVRNPDVIRAIDLGNEGFLTDKVVEQLIHGKFPVNFGPLLEAAKYSKMDEEDEDSIPSSWNNLTEVLCFVSKYVRENTPGWFDETKNESRA